MLGSDPIGDCRKQSKNQERQLKPVLCDGCLAADAGSGAPGNRTPHTSLYGAAMADAPQQTMTNEFLITKGEFNSAEQFSIFIECDAKRRNIEHMESFIDYCEHKDIEPAALAKSITSSLKQKLQAEAEDRNLLKTKSAKLPL
jgi:hypothetical protein